MPGFDISSLVEFTPPASRCWLCLALLPPGMASSTKRFRCPGCNSFYVPSNITVFSNTISTTPEVGSVLVGGSGTILSWPPVYGSAVVQPVVGRKISIGAEPMAHAVDLAELAVQLREASGENPPLRVLMKLLLASRSFIHITSFNFDEFTLALLEMAAQGTSIAATFSGVDPKRMGVLGQVPAEAPSLECRVEGTRADTGDQNHGKLIVIDGLLAVIGSPNLTRPAWRKAAMNMEIVEVVTNISRVAELNNRYFSPLWKRLQPAPETRYSILNWTIVTPEDPEHPDQQKGAAQEAPMKEEIEPSSGLDSPGEPPDVPA